MKKVFISISMLYIVISLCATDVSGNQTGNWNLAGSPYNIIGEITIPANETLEIDAGVEVVAMGNYKITALGNILAVGTQNDTIRFNGNGGMNWGGIRLEDELTSSVFYFCRISNTDDTNDYGIHSINSPVTIENSYFDDHQKAISFSGMASNTPSYMEFKNSKIAHVQKSGITIVDNSNVLIDSCEVTRCGLGAQFYGAIQLSLQNNSHSCSPTITNNFIHHNDKQGLTLANLFGYDNMSPIVEYNDISYNYTGIYLYVGKGTYKWNHIHHNFVDNNPDSGAGVMLYGDGADAIFTYNTIAHNYTGFYLTADATVNLGDLNNADPDDDGYNCIYDNIFYTGEEFSVYNTSSMDITAENNFWGSDDPAEIAITIIDGNDNPAYGIVDYEPFTPHILNPPQNLLVEISSVITLIWDDPQPGSTSPPDPLGNFNIYLDGDLQGSTNNNEWILVGLVNGQEYVAGVSANYEAGSSGLVEIQFILTGVPPFPPANVVLNPNLGILFWEDPQDPQFTLIGFNLFLDDVLQGNVNFDVFEYQLTGLVAGEEYVAGVSAVYEEGESDVVEVDFWTQHICNPPTIASYEIIDDYIRLTWEEPEPGSSHPFLNYRIYLDGELLEETTELSYDIDELVSGQTYNIGLTAYYEYLFESEPIEFEINFVESDDILNLETKLLGNYPNPFNPCTTISFSLKPEDAQNAKLEIYNLKGQKVKTYECHAEPVEVRHSFTWDGTDQNYQLVSSGVYFYKLVAHGKNIASKKMLLLK